MNSMEESNSEKKLRVSIALRYESCTSDEKEFHPIIFSVGYIEAADIINVVSVYDHDTKKETQKSTVARINKIQGNVLTLSCMKSLLKRKTSIFFHLLKMSLMLPLKTLELF